eukprot:m.108264 g.108264  ORF g.108264 m.108264 type:complete len:262 (-) comp13955_c0_seq2:211-996(-)
MFNPLGLTHHIVEIDVKYTSPITATTLNYIPYNETSDYHRLHEVLVSKCDDTFDNCVPQQNITFDNENVEQHKSFATTIFDIQYVRFTIYKRHGPFQPYIVELFLSPPLIPGADGSRCPYQYNSSQTVSGPQISSYANGDATNGFDCSIADPQQIFNPQGITDQTVSIDVNYTSPINATNLNYIPFNEPGDEHRLRKVQVSKCDSSFDKCEIQGTVTFHNRNVHQTQAFDNIIVDIQYVRFTIFKRYGAYQPYIQELFLSM